jgi:hypothetical protein
MWSTARMAWTLSETARLVAGGADLLAARWMASTELGRPANAFDAAVYRVIGARQLAQAAGTARTEWRALGALVDALHVATMLPVLVARPRWRRAAAVQLVFAGAMLALAAPRLRR